MNKVVEILKSTKILVLLLILCIQPTKAQSLLWDVDFLGYFDNREYKTDLSPHETLFGVRLSPEIGLGLLDNTHRLMVGASWIQPFGADIDEGEITPTVYYRYDKEKIKLSFGMFPRTQLIENLPSYMISDSMAIYSPNITGFLFQYQNQKGYGELYIDWTQMQSNDRREAFQIYAAGRWTPNLFLLGGNFNMGHLAGSSDGGEDESVMDHLSVQPYVGVDFTRLAPKLDTLSIRAGYYLGIERHRGTGESYTPNGVLIEANFAWRYILLNNITYIGGDMEPFYSTVGAQLYQGDPFYRTTSWYNRSDVAFNILQNSYINILASLNFHLLPSSFNFQQQLTVRFNLNDNIWKDKGNSKQLPDLRNIY